MGHEQKQYSLYARLLHWLMAAGFFFMWGSGYYMTRFVEDDSPMEEWLFSLHISTGVTLVVLLIIRIIIRVMTPPPPSVLITSAIEAVGAKLAHWGLYLLPALVLLAGWAEVDLGGHGVKWLGIAMPKVFPTLEHFHGINPADTAETLHKWLAYTTLGLTVLHIAAVVKHAREGHSILYRMSFNKR
ncbi:cytochrome b [Endozoicomonas arenosclerae]|uniref:cytochrome b n=1 Tax=Endozoicomonas arenosclerae TaxID=1633495 RepID=UPI000785351F|nr:cytochrome b/b6 domain-containing protein [Endozoicomonas arenosclerae]